MVALITVVTFLAAAAAWAGLAWLVTLVPPGRPLAVQTFYVLAFTALSGTAALALAAWRRGRGSVTSLSYLGHAMLLAAIVLFALWLQSLRMLAPPVALLLAGLFVFLELALLFGTRGSVELDVESRSSGGAEW